MSAVHVTFYYILPTVGCLLVLALASSPIKAMMDCERRGVLGPFNPFPPLLFFMTNLVWVINGLLLKDVFVFFINVLMVFVNGHITLRCYRMAEARRARQMEQLLCISSAIAMLFGFGFIYAIDVENVVFAYGWMCAALNMTVFVPPMLLIKDVIQTKNAIQINRPFAMVGAVCTAFWCMYGLLIPIFPLLIPNAFGCVLSLCQVVLTIIFPAHDGDDADGALSCAGGGDIETVVKVSGYDQQEEEEVAKELKPVVGASQSIPESQSSDALLNSI